MPKAAPTEQRSPGQEESMRATIQQRRASGQKKSGGAPDAPFKPVENSSPWTPKAPN
jgi:hypothetical protein